MENLKVMNNNTFSPDLVSSTNFRLKKLSFVLLQELNFVNSLMALAVGENLIHPKREETSQVEDNVSTATLTLMQAVTSSSNTILKLSETTGLHTKDCYIIARSIFEASLNTCYIFAAGNKVATDALEHSRAKSIKDLKRESKIGESVIRLSFIDSDTISIPPELKTLLRKYETKKGRDKSWTELNVDARIRFIGNKFTKNIINKLHMARFMIYRHSSEILHGSVFGNNYFLGALFSKSREELENNFESSIGTKHELVLLCCILSLSSILDCFHLKYGFENLHKLNKELLSNLKNDDYQYQEEDLIVPIITR